MLINLNTQVEVVLTEHGANHYTKKILSEKLPQTIQASILSRIKPGGTHRAALWDLMADFGDEMWLGNPNQVFKDNNIEVI